MSISGKSVLVTGANRGIGRALVDAALAKGASRVYAGTRQALSHSDDRVVPVTLDITDAGQVAAAVEQVGSIDVLVNNAGSFGFDDLSDPAVVQGHLDVNVGGTLRVTQAFLPALIQASGRIINIVSLSAISPVPMAPSYSMSKAALYSQTVALRTVLAFKNVAVHAVFPGLVDTEMTKDFGDVPKVSPEAVAKAVYDAVDAGVEEIFPDDFAMMIGGNFADSPSKALERVFAEQAKAALGG